MSLAVGLTAAEPAEWDGFVRAAPGWTHFHLSGWRRVIEQVFRHECPYLEARDGSGRLAGVLPLVRVKSALFGHFLVSMPFLNYGGPLGSEAAVQALASRASELAERGNAGLLELRSRSHLPLDLDVSSRKITVVLDLPLSPDALFAGFRSKLRSQIRRPQKEGVEVRFGKDQVAPFHAVFARHMRDLGTPALPRAFFEEIAGTFGEDEAWFGCAWLSGKPIACGCAFRWGEEVEMTWASALFEFNSVSPNMLLYWAFMERAANERLAVFNFGRCTPNSPTHRFKQQWGGRDVPLYWYQRARGVARTPSPDDSAWSWGPRIWRRLPLGLATALGPRIVRYIP